MTKITKKKIKRVKVEEWLSAQTANARREVARLIMDGKVSINGNVNTDLSMTVDPEIDIVHVNGERLANHLQYFYYKFHKPSNVISTMSDPNGRSCLRDFMGGVPAAVSPVGRLDRDSEGLLLFTNNGALTLALSHPRFHVAKIYRVTLDKPLTQAAYERLGLYNFGIKRLFSPLPS